MADAGRRMTDAEFRRLRAKIKNVYQEAYEDIYKKNLDFVKRHERKEARYRKMVNEGQLSKADFDAWMRGQVFQGKQWEAKRKQMQATLLHADEMAMDMINGSRVRVFADNANYIGYEIEQHGRIDSGFGLYDENTVRRLLIEEPDLLPPRKVGKDKSYQWYNRTIQNAATQGIIQGEKLYDIAKRIAQATGETNMNAMMRNARTMHTGAENAGRIEGLHQAQRLGINVKKRWLATLDNHTRDSHRDLDGQVQEVDDPFTSPLGKIMFPGDPSAFPGNVWNCRCTLTYVYPEYPDSMAQRRDALTGALVAAMSYKEWESMKQGKNVASQATTPPPVTHTIRGKTDKLAGSMTQADYDETVRMIDSSEAVTLYEQYGDSCNSIIQKPNAGAYSPRADYVEYGLESRTGKHKYSTMTHEMAHMFDAHMGRYGNLTFNEVDKLNADCKASSRFYFDIFKALPSQSDQFLSAMRRDKTELKKLLKDKDEIAKMKSGNLRNASAGIQDAMDGFFNTQDKGILPWGHGGKYYNRTYNGRIKGTNFAKVIKQTYTDLGFDASNQTKVAGIVRDYETASELWANCVSAITCGGEELAAFERYMPETVKAAREIIKEV